MEDMPIALALIVGFGIGGILALESWYTGELWNWEYRGDFAFNLTCSIELFPGGHRAAMNDRKALLATFRHELMGEVDKMTTNLADELAAREHKRVARLLGETEATIDSSEAHSPTRGRLHACPDCGYPTYRLPCAVCVVATH